MRNLLPPSTWTGIQDRRSLLAVRRSAWLAVFVGSLGLGLTTVPSPARAALAATDAGVSYLQARLPDGTALPQATYEQLTRAVSLATAAHRRDAESILVAALTRGSRGDARPDAEKPPCAWVSRLLHASVAAAPERASRLLELASSLCPDCADVLQTAVELFNDKNVVDDKKVVDGKDRPAATVPTVVSNTDPSTVDGLNLDDPETRNVGLLVGGFGPGFPGTPGFVGSVPGGSIALPSPILNPVTPAMND